MIGAQPGGRISRTMIVLSLASFLLGSTHGAKADFINFTGNVASDFPASTGTTVIDGRPGSVAESPYIIQNGWTTGFLVESLRLNYDRTSDTLFVGVQTYSIAGDADGNGDPGYTTPQMAAGGGINFAHFGGDKSLTVAFATASAAGGPALPSFVAGIPADKSTGDRRNTNEFTVATYNNTGRGLAYSYGTILENHVGALAVDPSASRPNFEFALTHFSQFPGFDPSKGYYVSLFLGSQRAIVVGKEALDWSKVPGLNPAPAGRAEGGGPINPPKPTASTPGGPVVPEPASVGLLLVGAGIALGASLLRRSA